MLATRPDGDARELARHWPHPAVPGVDLLRARYVRHTFARHSHEGFAIGVIEAGLERFTTRGAVRWAPAGSVILLNPGDVHDGRSGSSGGWEYRMIYPTRDVLAGVSAELVHRRGTPHFPEPVVADPVGARLVAAASRSAEAADRLTTSVLARRAFAHLLRAHARPAPERTRRPAGRAAVAAARELLHERLADPPSVEELAAAVDSRPFALYRAFRAETGLPPHAYLVQARVRRAADLLAGGVAPAEVAARLGFSDQAHLTRHFKRYLGVPPATYARERRNVQASPERPA